MNMSGYLLRSTLPGRSQSHRSVPLFNLHTGHRVTAPAPFQDRARNVARMLLSGCVQHVQHAEMPLTERQHRSAPRPLSFTLRRGAHRHGEVDDLGPKAGPGSGTPSAVTSTIFGPAETRTDPL